MATDTPVLDVLTDITAVSVNNCKLDPRELMLCRIAALAAIDAPAASYLANAGNAVDIGITIEDVQGILIAVAPVVGTPRIVSASLKIADALGFAISVMEAEAAEASAVS